MKIYLLILMILLSVSNLAAQGIPDSASGQQTADNKVTVFLKNGDRLSGMFISGNTKTIKISYSSAELSFKLSEVRSLTFGDNLAIFNMTTLPSISTSIGGRVISGGIVNGKAINLVKPAYPPAARAVGASGTVNVQVVIDEDGKVIAATAISGHPLLKQAAEQAARESTFSPTTLSGQKVKVTGVVVYSFAVDPPAAPQPAS